MSPPSLAQPVGCEDFRGSVAIPQAVLHLLLETRHELSKRVRRAPDADLEAHHSHPSAL